MDNISDFKIKNATSLAKANFPKDDPYYTHIQQAAKALVDAGMGHFIYATQWSKGTTVWRQPGSQEPGITVSPEGRIRK